MESLENLAKKAESEKYFAEARKAEAEKEKLDLEIAELKKSFSQTKEFKKYILSTTTGVILGIGILGAYISNILVPTFQKDKIEAQLEIAKKEAKLDTVERDLTVNKRKADSLLEANSSAEVKLQVLTFVQKSHADEIAKLATRLNGFTTSQPADPGYRKLKADISRTQLSISQPEELLSKLTIVVKTDPPSPGKTTFAKFRISGVDNALVLESLFNSSGSSVMLPAGRYKLESMDNTYKLLGKFPVLDFSVSEGKVNRQTITVEKKGQ